MPDLPYEIIVPPIIIILSSILIGMLFERIFIQRRTKCSNGELTIVAVVCRSLKGTFILLFALVGMIVAEIYLKLPEYFNAPLNKIFVCLMIFAVTIFAGRLSANMVAFYGTKSQGALQSTSLIENIVKIAVYTVGLLILLSFLGINILPLLTALGVGGLAVALALQDTLSNFFAGVSVTITRNIRPTDFIRLDTGQEGYVVDIGWRNTVIREISNNLIIVPNSTLVSTIVTNFHLTQQEMAIKLEVGVSYDSDLDKVEKIVTDVASQVISEFEGGVSEFQPFIYYHTFADFSINFTLVFRVKEFFNQFKLKSEMVKRIHERFGTEGIEIPFPIRTVHMKQGHKQQA